MSTEIIIVLIGNIATLLGVMLQNRKANADMLAKMELQRAVFETKVDERLGVLNKKMDKHNNSIERIYKLETTQAVHETRIASLENKLKGERYDG